MIIETKYFTCDVLLNDQISLSGCFFVRKILSNMCIAIVYQPGYDINKSYISNQGAFSIWLKSPDKNLDISRTKRAFKMK